MNFGIVFHTLGKVILCEGALLLLPLLVAFIFNEPSSISALVATILICLILGGLCIIRKPKSRIFYMREGFVLTAISWVTISIIGAIPFIITKVIPDPISAIFETVSGFTTTGSSVLSDVENMPRSILFWRSFTHWIGGMGVLVFVLMLRSSNNGSSANIMKAESPGPQVEKLVPKLQSTAMILYAIYFAFTIIEIVLLMLGSVSFFDAVTLSFGTAGTGGFGIRNDSIGSYSSYVQWVITIFMILFGVNFTFYFLILQKKLKKALFIEEIRWYFLIILASIFIIVLNLGGIYKTFGETIRHAAFQVGAIITTTGYSTADFDLWPETSKTILVILMFVGACAGSTGGGIKISRILVLIKTIGKEIKHFLHPNSVSKVAVGKKTVPHEVVRSINVYMAAYFIIFAVSLLLISFENHDFTTNFTAVTTTLNNIGPGLELVGPTQNFSVYSNWSKLVFIFNMLAGRLEIFPLLILFHRMTWRKF